MTKVFESMEAKRILIDDISFSQKNSKAAFFIKSGRTKKNRMKFSISHYTDVESSKWQFIVKSFN